MNHMVGRILRCSGGFTLLEVIVAIAVLGILTGIAGASWIQRTDPAPARITVIDSARSVAIRSGRIVTVTILDSSGMSTVTAFPDGRVIGADGFGYDALTGHRHRLSNRTAYKP